MDCFRGFVVFLIKNIKSKAFALYYGIECIPAAGCHQRILMSLFTMKFFIHHKKVSKKFGKLENNV